MKEFKEWFKKLLSDSNEVSSKRLISLICLLLMIIIIIYSLITKNDVIDNYKFLILGCIVTGTQLFTLFNQIKQ